jgi:hypothetical protein
VHPPWSYQAPSSSAKTAIYPNLTINSIILKREKGGRISVFLRKKGRVKNLPIGKARVVMAEAATRVARMSRRSHD